MLSFAWNHWNTNTWFVSPTYDQALVQYLRVVSALSPHQGAVRNKNQTQLFIQFHNGSTIYFKSGEVLDNLRGTTLHFAIVDEVRDQHPELWPQVLRPMLTTTQGRAVFVSTPNGFDAFYDFFERARIEPKWQSFHAPSTCNPLFTQEEYEAAKNDMSEGEFDQEINANFRDLVQGKAYLNAGIHNQTTTHPFAMHGSKISPYLPIIIACDFNIDPCAWVLGQHKTDTWYFFDELWMRNTNTQEMTRALIDKIQTHYPNHKPGFIVIGDATGKARQRAAAGESDYSILMGMLTEAGISVINETPESNPMVKDRVNTVNSKLKSADGTVRLFYNPITCPNLKKDFERVVWKSGSQAVLDQVKDRLLTHATDAIGYPVCYYSQQWKPSPGLLRVINR